MVGLLKPNKNKHQYVVGIDFGHGETSAAISNLEWNIPAGQRKVVVQDLDLDINARKKVITSAICRTSGGLYIGDEAFEHMTDNSGMRICFKQKPISLEGEAESLMIDYMKAVYNRIREGRDELTDDNHIVYIARPSGWVDEEAKNLYKQMAIKAGIPLAGLTSESRAAIFYAKQPGISFSNEISKGAIVFDLGSSTLDFTYLADDVQPIDYGYDLGASIIDRAIYKDRIYPNVEEFITNYPEYEGALLFKARKFKEHAYSRSADSKTIDSFDLEGNIIPDTEPACKQFGDTFIKLKISCLDELNCLIEAQEQYLTNLKKALINFKEEKIPGLTLKGVFLTGGASRMNFIRPLISEVLNIPLEQVKIDSDNPSVTISRGIALLGTADAISLALVEDLRKQLPLLLNNEKMFKELTNKLSIEVSTNAWDVIEASCKNWIGSGKTTDTDELKTLIQDNLVRWQHNSLNSNINSTFHSYFKDKTEDIRKKMNEIISVYAPGREISISGSFDLSGSEELSAGLQDMQKVMSEVCDNIGHIVADVLWAALGIFLFGIFVVPYYILKYMFTSDEDRRKDKVDEILDKKSEILEQLQNELSSKLNANNTFKQKVNSVLQQYFDELIDSNLKKVMIPIE